MDRGLELTSQAEATHFWFRGFRQFVAPVIERTAGSRRDLRLIDCGCGTGFNLALLSPYGKVSGFDLTAWGARRARATGHPIAQGDIALIPFATGVFDLAASFDVLQCVDADEAAVREMARIVKPGGAIVLTLAAFNWLRGDHAIAWNEFRRYTPSSARRLVEQAGLRPEYVRFTFASVFPVIAGARTLQRLLRPVRGVRDDTDMTVPVAPVNAALTALVTAEAALARRGWRMPIGSSIVVAARKGL
jgi:SAM-dependent methyltransferase